MIGKNTNIIINRMEFINGYSTKGIGGFQFQDSNITMQSISLRVLIILRMVLLFIQMFQILKQGQC